MAHLTQRLGAEAEPAAGLYIGLDAGSTTVKAVVVEPGSGAVLWRDYQRHETRQQDMCLAFLERIERAFPETPASAFRLFATGTGGMAASRHVGGCFVQEVNAVCLVVERLYPRTRSVVELGGEDAKIIFFRQDPVTGTLRKSASMNDKCAGGTGAVIDKIAAKLGLSGERLMAMGYDGMTVHPIAGKCGVFAETDINGLQKQGVPVEVLMASLFDSLVRQNLSVLARGNTLQPDILLLGGPNTFLRGMQECWRHHLKQIWDERGVDVPEPLADHIFVPEHALYFAALGAVEYGLLESRDNPELGRYLGAEPLRAYLAARKEGEAFPTFTVHGAAHGGAGEGSALALPGLAGTETALCAFRARYERRPWTPPVLSTGECVEGFLGIDGGSTSTKAVLLDRNEQVVAKAYRLSQGNPVEDAKAVVRGVQEQIEGQGARLHILGVATTGYAKDMLRDVLCADMALVETVAHMQSGIQSFPEADVICDVGGQDIKIIILKNGAVKDFRLNTQCSAGNGYYLQSTAAAFGFRLEEYADVAFRATRMPNFGYGCAVFLQSDIVDFQRQGWQPHEILAGLAAVLPKNIWLYVCQMPNLSRLGRRFVLQGGTQYNLAAVKAQVDFIASRFEGTGITPEVTVHPHCGESGAIGCALEALRRHRARPYASRFVGLEALASIEYTARRDESTRCGFCPNRCLRTFLDVRSAAPEGVKERRIIVASCEQGATEDLAAARRIGAAMQADRAANPNLAAISGREVFRPVQAERVADALPEESWLHLPPRRSAVVRRRALMQARERVVIGMPRALGLYSYAPFFMGYFQSLGIPAQHVVWSAYTTERLFAEGSRRGSIDPCYPSKLAIAHIHNLLYHKHTDGRRLTHIFFPVVDTFPTWLHGVRGSRACPTSMASVESTYAAFVKESDLFAERGIRFKRTFVELNDATLCAHQLYEDWTDELGLSEAESLRAVEQGRMALRRYEAARHAEGRLVLEQVQREGRLAIVLLARPYHNDPGINHGIPEEFQRLGYPILTQDSLPLDPDIIEPLFGPDIAAGVIDSPFSIDDVWKNSFAENSSRKLWAAKFVARHPHLIGFELSNFKCGHDAPTYATLEDIIEYAGKPLFYFREIDENKPAGSIRIRVETIAYYLERYRERIRKTGGFPAFSPLPGLSRENQEPALTQA